MKSIHKVFFSIQIPTVKSLHNEDFYSWSLATTVRTSNPYVAFSLLISLRIPDSVKWLSFLSACSGDPGFKSLPGDQPPEGNFLL
jgi:hypothetical protein